MIPSSCQRPTEMERLLHDINGGLHNVALALQLLSDTAQQRASPTLSPTHVQALVEAGMGGLDTAREALLKLGAALAREALPAAEGRGTDEAQEGMPQERLSAA